MNYSKYDGFGVEDFADRNNKRSFYNHNFFVDRETENVIKAISDDDNYTYYVDITNNVEFAESFTDEGDIMHVYSNFLIDDK